GIDCPPVSRSLRSRSTDGYSRDAPAALFEVRERSNSFFTSRQQEHSTPFPPSREGRSLILAFLKGKWNKANVAILM
ncbi:MAG: hypothetical protein FWC38_01145, partial [Proteobacteria bacterium]|nr:hypothetical protein [Pseudomonadota bacterium]MCL2306849.1 hypothetical protein [Pseudomonadota bacterium]